MHSEECTGRQQERQCEFREASPKANLCPFDHQPPSRWSSGAQQGAWRSCLYTKPEQFGVEDGPNSI